MSKNKTVLITGGAKRIGSAIAHALHAENYNVMVHYRSSAGAAEGLICLLYTSPSPRDRTRSRMPSSA